MYHHFHHYTELKNLIVTFSYKNQLVTFNSQPFKTIYELKLRAFKRFSDIPDDVKLYYMGKDFTKYENEHIGTIFKGKEKVTLKLRGENNDKYLSANHYYYNITSNLDITSTNKNTSEDYPFMETNFQPLNDTNENNDNDNNNNNNNNYSNISNGKIANLKQRNISNGNLNDITLPSICTSNNNIQLKLNSKRTFPIRKSNNKLFCLTKTNRHPGLLSFDKSCSKEKKNKRPKKQPIKICENCILKTVNSEEENPKKNNPVTYYCRNCKSYLCTDCKNTNTHKNHLTIFLDFTDLNRNVKLYTSLLNSDISQNITYNNLLIEKRKRFMYDDNKRGIDIFSKQRRIIDKLSYLVKVYTEIIKLIKSDLMKIKDGTLEEYTKNYEDQSKKIMEELDTTLLDEINNNESIIAVNNKETFNKLEKYFNKINEYEKNINELEMPLHRYQLINEVDIKVNIIFDKLNKILDKSINEDNPLDLNMDFCQELKKLAGIDANNSNYATKYKSSNNGLNDCERRSEKIFSFVRSSSSDTKRDRKEKDSDSDCM